MNTATDAVEQIVREDSPLALPPSHSVDVEVDIEVLKTVPKLFAVVDEASANWVVKKVVAARQYAQRVKEWSSRRPPALFAKKKR